MSCSLTTVIKTCTVIWYRNTTVINESSDTKIIFDGQTARLSISKSKTTHSGTYKIVFKNEAGQDESTAEVKVTEEKKVEEKKVEEKKKEVSLFAAYSSAWHFSSYDIHILTQMIIKPQKKEEQAKVESSEESEESSSEEVDSQEVYIVHSTLYKYKYKYK